MRETPEGDVLSLAAPASAASRLTDGLWMGSVPLPGCRPHRWFDMLVLCAIEYQVPHLFPGLQTVLAPMNDDGSPMTEAEGRIAVRAAGEVVRALVSGRRILVTCMMGRNRSGLVSALALCRGPARMSPKDATAAIRAARGDTAMRNPYFNEFLENFCVRASAAESGRGEPFR